MIERRLSERLVRSLQYRPVVLLTGARQTGKTTLARNLGSCGHDADYITLDSATALGAANHDPEGFVRGLSGPVIVDEVQHAPGILRAIKMAVDESRQPGRFLLTGSANLMLLPRISETLAGRMDVLTLGPLSEAEIAGRRTSICDMVFAGAHVQAGRCTLQRDAVLTAVCRGGYPEPLTWPHTEREAWFESYVSTMLRRDVRDIAQFDDVAAMARLLRLLASRVSGILSASDVSRAIELPYTSTRRYLNVLEAAYLLRLVPAWATNPGVRVARAPKAHLVDTGLAAHLMGVSPESLGKGHAALGPLLESFVVGEFAKDAEWSTLRPRLYHFRSASGREVDLVLEDRAGRVVGIEVKATSSVTSSDLRGIAALQAASQDRFTSGVVAYLGDRVVPFDEHIHAVPVPRLVAMGSE